MPMIHQCKCDACGVVVSAHKTVGEEYGFPHDWHVAQWTVRLKGIGLQHANTFAYCPACSEKKLFEATMQSNLPNGNKDEAR